MNRALARNDNPIKRNIQVPLECYFCGREDEMEGHLICEFAARVRSCSLLGIKVEAAGRVHITSWISNYFNFFWKDGPDGTHGKMFTMLLWGIWIFPCFFGQYGYIGIVLSLDIRGLIQVQF